MQSIFNTSYGFFIDTKKEYYGSISFHLIDENRHCQTWEKPKIFLRLMLTIIPIKSVLRTHAIIRCCN